MADIDRQAFRRQAAGMITMHASAVAINGQALLLRGPAGSGKSDLALRLIDEGADLISDDYVELHVENNHILVKPPQTIRGLMEVRGSGLMTFPYLEKAVLAIAFDLVSATHIDRLPDRDTILFIDGIPVPLLQIDGMGASSTARIKLFLARLDDIQQKRGDQW